MTDDRESSRRKFLQYVASSPLWAGSAGALAADEFVRPIPKPTDPLIWAPLDTTTAIKSPKDAINVFDFEIAARQTIPPSHFGYMAAGIDDEVTLRIADFAAIQGRVRWIRKREAGLAFNDALDARTVDALAATYTPGEARQAGYRGSPKAA